MFALSTPSLAQSTVGTSGSTSVVTTRTTAPTTIVNTFTAASLPEPVIFNTVVTPPVNTTTTTTINVDSAITTSGTVGGGDTGVFVSRTGDGDLTLTNDANIIGVSYAIKAIHSGVSTLNVINNGRIEDVREDGIHATRSDDGLLSVGSSGSISAKKRGIHAFHDSAGEIKVSTSSSVEGDEVGVHAKHTGSGDLSIDVNDSGRIISLGKSVYAKHTGSGDLSIDVNNSGMITSSGKSVYAKHTGGGDLSIDVNNSGRITSSGKGVFAKHEGKDGDLNINVNDSGGIDSWDKGVYAHHDGGGKVTINVHSEAEIGIRSRGKYAVFVDHDPSNAVGSEDDSVEINISGEIWGYKGGIVVNHSGTGTVTIDNTGSVYAEWNDGIQVSHTGGGQVEIDLSGEVESNNGNIINITSDGKKTLTLRPGFLLKGRGSAVSSGAGNGFLVLNSPHAKSSVSEGDLNLGALNLRGFKRFAKKGNSRWIVSGVADADNGAFERAKVDEGTLRFSGATFLMSGHRFLIGSAKADASLEIVGHNHLTGNLQNAGNGRIVFDNEGQPDTLTVTGNYENGQGRLIFDVYSTGWDNDKLTIKGNTPQSNLRADVSVRVLEPKDGITAGTTIDTDSPALIEVEGAASAEDFVGSIKNINNSGRDYVLKHKKIAGDVHAWYFAEAESESGNATGDSGDAMLEDTQPEPAETRSGGLPFRADVREYAGGAWAERRSSRTSLESSVAAGGRSHTQSDRVHFGFNLPATRLAGGDVVVGASVWQGFSISDVSSWRGEGGIGIESHAAALTALWWSPGGFYAEGQARHVRFSSDILSDGVSLVRDNGGTGMSASAEAGYRLAVPLGEMDLRVAPQAQLFWSRVGFDDFVSPHGELISMEDGETMTARLGFSWDGEWRDARGFGHVYGGLNLRGALDGATAVNVSGTSLAREREDLSFDGRLGVSYEWDEGYGVYGEAMALRRDGAEEARAKLGVRIDF